MIDTEVQKGFQTILDGKDEIANAIKQKGISAKGTETFSSLANKITQIEGGGSEGESPYNYVALKPFSELSSSPKTTFELVDEDSYEYKTGLLPDDETPIENAVYYCGYKYGIVLEDENAKADKQLNWTIEYKISAEAKENTYMILFPPNYGSAYDNLICDGEYHTIDLTCYLSSTNFQYSSYWKQYYDNYFTSDNIMIDKNEKATYSEFWKTQNYEDATALYFASDKTIQSFEFYVIYKNYQALKDYPIYFKFRVKE
jgi:hypothetical protein